MSATADAIGAAVEAAASLADGTAAWPEADLSLIRPEAIPAPSWPEKVLPPRWERWTREAAEGAGAPHAFVASALLSAVGAVIGNARWSSPWPGWQEPPALNVALVGAPSSGKSPALDRVVNLVSKLEADENADYESRMQEARRHAQERAERKRIWEAETRAAVRDGTPVPPPPEGLDEPEMPPRRRLFSVAPTPEAAAYLSADNPRGLLLIRDELAGWISGMDRYANGAGGERQFWLQSHGGRPWTADRVKDGQMPLMVPHLLWSIAGGIQPDRLPLMLDGADDGLSSRFALFCWPAALPPRRPTCRADDEGALARLARIRSLPWEPPEPVVVPFSDQAADVIQEWRVQVAGMEADAAGIFLSWLGKLPGAAVRLALILELMAWSESQKGTSEPREVSERSAVAACALLEVFAIPMARRCFGSASLPQAERDARRLARWLIRQSPLPETVNARELRRRANGPTIPSAERVEAALRELEAAGWCRPAPVRAGDLPGRARANWAINPALRGRAA